MPSVASAVHVRGLKVAYGTAAGRGKAFRAANAPGAEPIAVDDVTISVGAGELFALIGPSGCGKTTLLRSVAGFVAPTAGSIWFGDEDVTRMPAHRRRAGMVFQSLALWPHMTVAENVGFGLREQHVAASELHTRVEEALATTRLAGYGRRPVDELSGGEQQRVALARALVVRPRCLLLDEPLSSLDARLRRSMREEIRTICKAFGLTTIYVTHDQEEALAIADRIGVMQAGRLLQVGSPTEIYRAPRTRDVATFVGETNLVEGKIEGTINGEIEGQIEKTLAAADGPVLAVRTAAGLLRAATPVGFAAAVGDAIWVSLRPESLRIRRDANITGDTHASSDATNRWTAEHTSTVFLGAIAEHRLQVGPVALTVRELGSNRAVEHSGRVVVEVSPGDVVLLPFDEPRG